MDSRKADDSQPALAASNSETSPQLRAPYGQRRVLFAQDFGIQEDAQQQQNYAAAFKVGDLETVFEQIKEHSNSQDWGEKLNYAPLVTKLAVHICSRWLKRRCSKVGIFAQHDVQESEMEIYYDTVCLLIQTMVFAMRADFKVNANERQVLYDFCLSLFGSQITNIRGQIDLCLTMPLELSSLLPKISYAEERLDIFILSAVLLNNDGLIYDGYLDNLAATLDIDPSLARSLRYRAKNLIELGANGIEFKELDRLYSENRLVVAKSTQEQGTQGDQGSQGEQG